MKKIDNQQALAKAQIHFLVEPLDERQLNEYEEWLEQDNKHGYWVEGGT